MLSDDRDQGSPLADLAAACAVGIVKAHAFVDGNKRTAFVTALSFLRLNGQAFRPGVEEGVRTMEGLAAGEVSEAEFARWLAAGMSPIDGWSPPA